MTFHCVAVFGLWFPELADDEEVYVSLNLFEAVSTLCILIASHFTNITFQAIDFFQK